MEVEGKDYIIDHHGFKNKIVEKINDPRLTTTMDLCRSWRIQVFREPLNSKGERKRHFANEKDEDVITLKHEKQEYYAKLIEDEWYWINGCYECNGEKRDWMCYSICNEHNVCRTCGIHSSDPKVKVRHGGKEGWQCNTCHDIEESIQTAEWRAKIPEEFDRWDFMNLDTVKCPWCGYEWDHYDACESHHKSSDKEEECHMCKNKFKVTGEYKVEFTMERVDG